MYTHPLHPLTPSHPHTLTVHGSGVVPSTGHLVDARYRGDLLRVVGGVKMTQAKLSKLVATKRKHFVGLCTSCGGGEGGGEGRGEGN